MSYLGGSCQSVYDEESEFHRAQYFRRPEPPKPKAPVWFTGDGEGIPIDKMEDSHVQNTINYLSRRSDQWDVACEKASAKGVDLGDMIVNGLTVHQWLANFYAEVKRRQLT